MSVLGDLRKLLFGAKAVASSAANKAVEAGKEAGETIVEKSGEFLERAANTAGDLYVKATDKADDLYQAAKEKVEDITDSIWDTAAKNQRAEEPVQTPPPPKNADEFVASTVLENPVGDSLHMKEDPYNPQPEAESEPNGFTKTGEKILDTAAEAGSKLREKTAELGGKLKDAAEDMGAKLAEKGSEAIDRARELGGQLKEKLDDLVDKASQEAEKDRQEQEAIKAAAAAQEAEWQKRAADKGAESTLGGMDSFFEKAKRYAEGDYHNTGATPTPADDPEVLELKPDPNFKKDKKEDDLIDDAIIDKD